MIIKPRRYRIDVFYGIVAHEMVHVWCMHTNHNERDSHGVWFQARRAKAEQLAGFKIPPKDVKLDDDERGPAQPVAFIAGKKLGQEVLSLFQPRALDSPMTQAQADGYCKQMVERERFAWAIFGKAHTSLADSIPLQRNLKDRLSKNNFYKQETRLLTQMQVMGSYGSVHEDRNSTLNWNILPSARAAVAGPVAVPSTEVTYHKDIGLPNDFEQPKPGMVLRYGQHAKERADEKGVPLPAKLPQTVDIIEVQMMKYRVLKWVLRFQVSLLWDVVMVVLPDGFVKTAWLNSHTDLHRTLDRSKYAAKPSF